VLSDRFRNVDLYEIQTKNNEKNPFKLCIHVRLHLQLQFIIHFFPVSSGFRRDTRAFRSLLHVVYALHTVQGTFSTNAQLSSAISRMTLGASVVC